jgi:transcriptional regulator with PAS, ATPase and Fis domain
MGEFIKVGSSQVQKTDVRIVAATQRQFIWCYRKGESEKICITV